MLLPAILDEDIRMERKDMKNTDESGFIMIVTLLVLLVLTIVCTAALDESAFERQIVGNYRQSHTVFNLADGGVSTSFVILDQATDTARDYVRTDGTAHPDLQFNSADGDSFLAGNVDNIFARRVKGYVDPRTDGNYDFRLGQLTGERFYFRLNSRSLSDSDGSSVESHMGSAGMEQNAGKNVNITFVGVAINNTNARSIIEGRYVIKP